jgi:hypothetical protein
MGHCSIWDKALSAPEVAEVRGGGTPPDLLATSMAGNLVLWYKLDESDRIEPGGIIDHSPSGFHGTSSPATFIPI